jgi:hypothetical protein
VTRALGRRAIVAPSAAVASAIAESVAVPQQQEHLAADGAGQADHRGHSGEHSRRV